MQAPDSTLASPSIINDLVTTYPDLDLGAAQGLLDVARVMEFPAGQKLFTSADPCRGVMWILEGSVRVHRHALDGREVTLYRVQPSDLCLLSLYTLFHGGNYAAEAHSETRLIGVVVPPQEMLNVLDRNPKIHRLLLRLLTGRLQELVELVSESVFSRLELRLACLLGQWFCNSKNACVDVTHQELANELGCTREVVSRLLKEFERMGCIRLHRGQIELLSMETLARLGDDSK